MRTLFAASLLALSLHAFADSPAPAVSPDAWQGAHPSLEINVTRGAEPDTYSIKAVVTDLRNDTILSRPELLTRAGSPARFELGGVGIDGAISLKLEVTVDPDGQTATYASEIRDNA